MEKLLIRGGRLADVVERRLVEADVLVGGGRVLAIGRQLAAPDARVIDATGLIVSPGFVDLHVHLREPGFEHKETIETGTRAAAAGGFTTVACMPNTQPVLDSVPQLADLQQRIDANACVNVLPIAAITSSSQGVEPVDYRALKAAGAVAFSDDGRGVMNSRLMLHALQAAADLGVPIIAHEEDHDLAAGGSINAGPVSARLGDPGIPGVAEYAPLARDIYLSRLAGGHLHVAHVSCAESVELIRRAKARGVPVTAEVTPQHLILTEEIVPQLLGQAKVNPPLRSETDRQALLAGLLDGTIDAIATDHAPHARSEKELPLSQAAFGLSGLDVAFAALNHYLVETGIIPLVELLASLTCRPAAVLGLDAGRLQVGAAADLAVLDPGQAWQVSEENLYSKGKNTPFLGQRLTGRVLLTLVGGRVVHDQMSHRQEVGS
ncbi:MAG: dihydroorotase [Bacillota bacterium]